MNYEEKIVEILKMHDYWANKYKELFGEESLDWINTFDPLHPSPIEVEDGIKMLKNAIDKNEPIPNHEPEIELIY